MKYSTSKGWLLYIIFGHLLFVALLVLSIVHLPLRVGYVDSAFQVFKWIQVSEWNIEANRYSAIVPQALVKLFRALGYDLKTLLLVASVAHVLVSWAIFTLCAHVFRKPWVAAACVMAVVLCTRYTFYGMVLELHYLLIYPFLFIALTDPPRIVSPLRFVVGAALIIIAMLAHPVGVLVMLFLLGVMYLNNGYPRKAVIGWALVTVAWAIVGKWIMPPTGYESELYSSILEGMSIGLRGEELPSLDFLWGHTIRDTTLYIPAWIILAITLYWQAKRNARWLFVLTLGWVIGFVLLTGFTWYKGDVAVMMEKNFLPLATVVSFAFFFEIKRLPATWIRIIAIPFIVVLFIQFRAISFASKIYEKRYATIEALLVDAQSQSVRKAVYDRGELMNRNLKVVWALPFESLIISSLHPHLEPATLVTTDDLDDDFTEDGVFLMPWQGAMSVEDFNGPYFNLPAGPYYLLDIGRPQSKKPVLRKTSSAAATNSSRGPDH